MSGGFILGTNDFMPPRVPKGIGERRGGPADWRHQQIESLLNESEESRLNEENPDIHVREYVRFVRIGAPEPYSFYFAHRAHAENERRGIASLIRAMWVANYCPAEIAAHVGAGAHEVAEYLRIYWDVLPGAASDIVWPLLDQPSSVKERLLEKLLLATAINRGRFGLERLFGTRLTPPRVPPGRSNHGAMSESIARRVFAMAENYSVEERRRIEPYSLALKRVLMHPPAKNRLSQSQKFAQVMAGVAAGGSVSTFLRHHGIS